MRTLTITSLALDADNALVRVKVEEDGIDVTPPALNPITIVNPPILVPDPRGEVERVSVDPVTGEESYAYFREDPRAAILDILASLV